MLLQSAVVDDDQNCINGTVSAAWDIQEINKQQQLQTNT